jgi:predicted enzyme related to lactoylglutathione lyase
VTVEAIKAESGRVVADPHEAPTGKLTIVADPAGGIFGLWQGESFYGSELINEPGSSCWNELNSKDTSAAGEFFGTVFGVEARWPFDGFDYVVLTVGGRSWAYSTFVR